MIVFASDPSFYLPPEVISVSADICATPADARAIPPSAPGPVHSNAPISTDISTDGINLPVSLLFLFLLPQSILPPPAFKLYINLLL